MSNSHLQLRITLIKKHVILYLIPPQNFQGSKGGAAGNTEMPTIFTLNQY